jgi:hypothetical protein
MSHQGSLRRLLLDGVPRRRRSVQNPLRGDEMSDRPVFIYAAIYSGYDD